MKITIAYLSGEEQEAESIHRFAKSLLKLVKVHRSDRHAPYRHIYIATKTRPDTPCNNEPEVV